MNYVLDSSFCGALIMPDENSDIVNDFFYVLSEDEKIYVPAVFWFEISNLVTSAVRRNRIVLSEISSLIELLPEIKINTDFSHGNLYSMNLANIAARVSISSYDAAYAELAIRRKAELGTLDQALATACINLGVKTVNHFMSNKRKT